MTDQKKCVILGSPTQAGSNSENHAVRMVESCSASDFAAAQACIGRGCTESHAARLRLTGNLVVR